MHDENTVLVPLTQGKFAIIDAEDAEKILQHSWYLRCNGYAGRSARNPNGGNQITILMHRELIEVPDGMFIDHINRDRLDNRKCNFRIVTRAQNMMNKSQYRNNTSGFRGVTWMKSEQLWVARIDHNRKAIFLGYFKDPEEAARAYDAAAREYRGDFAALNFPDHD